MRRNIKQRGEVAVFHRRVLQGFDAAKVPVYEWLPDAEPLGRCLVEPVTASNSNAEPTEVDSRQVVENLRLYFREPVTVTAADRVHVRGNLWEIEGAPAVWVNPAGDHVGTVVNVKRRIVLG